MLAEVRSWMDQKGIASVAGLKRKEDPPGGPDPALVERAHYIRTIVSTTGKFD